MSQTKGMITILIKWNVKKTEKSISAKYFEGRKEQDKKCDDYFSSDEEIF